jgi:hypothetical protein
MGIQRLFKNPSRKIYRVSQEEKSVFWEVIISVILSRNIYMTMCSIPKSFRDTVIWLNCSLALIRYVNMHSDEQHAMSWHELQSALMLTVEFSKFFVLGKLYRLFHLNDKYRYSLSYEQFCNSAVKWLYLGNRSEWDTCSYKLLCLEWPIL